MKNMGVKKRKKNGCFRPDGDVEEGPRKMYEVHSFVNYITGKPTISLWVEEIGN